MLSVNEAIKNIISLKKNYGTEYVSLSNSLNRIIAEDIYADRDYPPYNRSAMDGYAINSEDLISNKITKFKVITEVYAGDNYNFPLRSGEAVKIMTGAVVPDLTDVVIRKEDAHTEGDYVSFNGSKFSRHQNIAFKGEDLKKDELVIPKHTQVNFKHLSALASVGKIKVKVYSLPKVAILSTGHEVKPAGTDIEDFQIRDSNSYSISGFLDKYSIKTGKNKIVPDNLKKLKTAIEKNLIYDVLILSGGVSAGEADLVPTALKECGFQEIFHKAKIKPGKPIWFGYYPGGTRVFALPGNPLSVQTACKIFIEPYIRACFSLPVEEPFYFPIGSDKKKKTNFDEYFPVKLLRGQCTRLQPVQFNGSGDVTALVNADGLARHPADIDEIQQGAMVQFYPFNNI